MQNRTQIESTDKILALIAHLGFFSGVGFFFAPLIIWLLKKDSSFVADHAKQAMVWQGSVFVLGTLFGIGGFVLSFATAGLAALLVVPAGLLLGLLVLVPALIASVKVFNGESYVYPVSGALAEKL